MLYDERTDSVLVVPEIPKSNRHHPTDDTVTANLALPGSPSHGPSTKPAMSIEYRRHRNTLAKVNIASAKLRQIGRWRLQGAARSGV